MIPEFEAALVDLMKNYHSCRTLSPHKWMHVKVIICTGVRYTLIVQKRGTNWCDHVSFCGMSPFLKAVNESVSTAIRHLPPSLSFPLSRDYAALRIFSPTGPKSIMKREHLAFLDIVTSRWLMCERKGHRTLCWKKQRQRRIVCYHYIQNFWM